VFASQQHLAQLEEQSAQLAASLELLEQESRNGLRARDERIEA
jgi:hypothetical protein